MVSNLSCARLIPLESFTFHRAIDSAVVQLLLLLGLPIGCISHFFIDTLFSRLSLALSSSARIPSISFLFFLVKFLRCKGGTKIKRLSLLHKFNPYPKCRVRKIHVRKYPTEEYAYEGKSNQGGTNRYWESST